MRKYTTLYLSVLLSACGGGSGTDSQDVCVTDRLNHSECFTVTMPKPASTSVSSSQSDSTVTPSGGQSTATATASTSPPGPSAPAVVFPIPALPAPAPGPASAAAAAASTPDPDGLTNTSKSQQCIQPEASNETFCQMPFLRPQYKFVVGKVFVYGDNKHGIAIVPSDNAPACRIHAQPCSDYDASDIAPTPPTPILAVACQQKFSAPMEFGRTLYCGAPEGAPTSSNASAFTGG